MTIRPITCEFGQSESARAERAEVVSRYNCKKGTKRDGEEGGRGMESVRKRPRVWSVPTIRRRERESKSHRITHDNIYIYIHIYMRIYIYMV